MNLIIKAAISTCKVNDMYKILSIMYDTFASLANFTTKWLVKPFVCPRYIASFIAHVCCWQFVPLSWTNSALFHNISVLLIILSNTLTFKQNYQNIFYYVSNKKTSTKTETNFQNSTIDVTLFRLERFFTSHKSNE